MTTIEKKAKKFVEEHKEELVATGALACWIGAVCMYGRAYKRGYETGREDGMMEFFFAMVNSCNKSEQK